MSALSTPGGGGTTAQSKPTSGKQKYQKLDINRLYCANKNENSEPSSVKSQLSRKHGMQSLGKIPSTRRPPANLPSLKTETGLDPNANSVTTPSTSVSSPPTCISQTLPTTSNSVVGAGAASGGWVSLPPPSSPHFRTEFPSLEAAAQPSHRAEHSTIQPQLRPQTEGSWTCGGTAGARPENASSPVAAPPPAPATQQPPAYRAILPSFLVKGSSGGLGLGGLNALRSGGGAPGPRGPPRAPPTPRAVEVLTARPILRDEQISSLDDISRDAGWAQHDDIDYDQKLDFSDGETSVPSKGSNKNNVGRGAVENERGEQKCHDAGDEEQLWAERRQKQSNEVAQAVARARQRKEEEQRRQMHANAHPPHQAPANDYRDRGDRDRNDNRDRDSDTRDKDNRERTDARDRMDRQDDRRDKERNDPRDRDPKDRADNRDRDRAENRDRDRAENRDRFDRERDRDKLESRDNRGRTDNRERVELDKERMDPRDRDRNDNRDRDRFDRERDRDRDRDRDRERDRGDRDRNDRDRDYRDRDRDYARDQNNPGFLKNFQANIPPRFLKQQQNRQEDQQHKGWAFTGKPAARRQEPPPYNVQRHPSHNGRRSYSRDYSDREEDFKRDKDGSGPQWRSEMQDYERTARELERSNSKDSYKDGNDFKGKNEADRKHLESMDQSGRSAAEKLSEVFERKSVGIIEPFASQESSTQNQSAERRISPPSIVSRRESSEKECTKSTSWAEASQEEANNLHKTTVDQVNLPKDTLKPINPETDELKRNFPQSAPSQTSASNVLASTNQNQHKISHLPNNQSIPQVNAGPSMPQPSIQPANQVQSSNSENLTAPKALVQPHPQNSVSSPQIHKTVNELPQSFAKVLYPSQKSEKEVASTESFVKPDLQNVGSNYCDSQTAEGQRGVSEATKRALEDKRSDDHYSKVPGKEPVERKSSGSGSEKKGRGFGSGGYAVYNRGWGPRESRGRRSNRSSRSNNRASESDGSTDGTQNTERKERRRAPRSPRGPKKSERPEDINRATLEQALPSDGMENREPFAPRGQPSRRGRGSFQGASRPPAPAKRVTGYGPPNTKSPFSQANRAITVKETEESKDIAQVDDKSKGNNINKPRTGSSTGRGRDRRPKGPGGHHSGEDENWETTSEHSEGGGTGSRRRSIPARQAGQPAKIQGGRNQNQKNQQNNGRNNNLQGVKRDAGDNKTADFTEAMTDVKLPTAKKDDDAVDDGFQEVRNKKNSKDTRGPPLKEDNQQLSKQHPRSHSNQGGGRNGSSSRNSNEKSNNNTRGTAQVPTKNAQYERPRQANLAPRFVKQRQNKQLGLVSSYGPDTGAAPPPPAVNAWDKPISQTLRGNIEEPPTEVAENKSGQSSQRSTPAEVLIENKSAIAPSASLADKSGVLDGTTPPVETIIFENTNYKSAPPEEALQPKYQLNSNVNKPQAEEIQNDLESRSLPFNGEVRPRPRSIQELIGDNGRPVVDGDASLGLQMSFEAAQKSEDSSDMKLDFAFDSDLGQLTEDKSAKTLGLPRGVHMSTSNTISPLAADLNLKIASVKKVWEMPAVAEGSEDLQFSGFEESNTETGAPPNVCKVKPTQQLQSPPPQLYNHVGYQGGYGGLSVPSPPTMLFNSSQQLVGSSQQLQQQGSLYGAFLDQSRGQFGGFPGTPYGAGSAAPYNYQPPPDMFQGLPNQYRMATAGGGAAFGQSGQLGNSPSTVLISSTSNSLMSATVKPSSQQIGAIGSKGGGVGGVGGVSAYQQQYLGYSAPVGEAPYSLPGLLPRPAPPASSYYSPYQPPAAPAPTYPLQFTQQAQSGAFGSQFLSSQLQVAAAAVQQMQQQYRAPMQQQYAPPPQPRPPPQQQQQQQLKSPLHEHANGFAPLCESASPTPKGTSKPQKPPHSPPQHKYHAPPPHPPPAHTPHQHHQQQMVSAGGSGRCGGGGAGGARGSVSAPRYPAPIQRPHAPALPLYRAPPHQPHQQPRHHAPRPNLYYHHHQRNGGGGGGERAAESGEGGGGAEEGGEAPTAPDPPPAAEVKAE